MKCRNCKCNGFLTDDDGKQFSWCHRYGDNLDIDEERYCPGYTPATNAERIRAMTDEELAEFITKHRFVDKLWCERWLKQEATQ